MTDPRSDIRVYIPYDEYIFRKVSDICLDFVNTYKDINTGVENVVPKLENLFECLLDFAQNSPGLPENIRNPPLEDWMLSPDNIHPRLALNWVMRLLNELKRQQDKRGREPDHYVKDFLQAKATGNIWKDEIHEPSEL